MNRNLLRQLARVRLRDARILLRNGNYAGAYYLCGYAVECALKACVARKTLRYDFPDKRAAQHAYTHDLKKLVGLASLQTALDRESQGNPNFELNWSVVKDWTEDSRYQLRDRNEARDLYSAITSRRHGVIRWIRRYWVDKDIQEGERVIKALDDAGFEVRSAFWFLFPEPNEWRLIIASPYVDKLGPRRAYFQLQRVIKSKRVDPPVDLTLRDFSLVSPKQELVRLLRTFIQTGRGIAHARLTQNIINGVLIEDAYLYRVQ